MAIATWPIDHFLIAMPAIADPDFARSVMHICRHDHDGAMRMVIHRTADLTRGEVLRPLKLPAEDAGVASVRAGQGMTLSPRQRLRAFIVYTLVCALAALPLLLARLPLAAPTR